MIFLSRFYRDRVNSVINNTIEQNRKSLEKLFDEFVPQQILQAADEGKNEITFHSLIPPAKTDEIHDKNYELMKEICKAKLKIRGFKYKIFKLYTNGCVALIIKWWFMFRLVIDIPVGEEEKDAIYNSDGILALFRNAIQNYNQEYMNKVMENAKFRMQKDEDRTVRNYLDKDENGKAKTSKTKLI